MSELGLELSEKRRRVLDLAAQHGLDGIVLTSLAAVAWFTGGADLHVARNSSEAVGSVLVTEDRLLVLTNSSETSRLRAEEFVGTCLEVVERPWHQPAAEQIAREARSLRIGVDDYRIAAAIPGAAYLGPEIAGLRSVLTPAEVDRYREVGRLTGEAIEAAARAVGRGMTEFQVAALLDHALLERGMEPTVTLIAADERIRRFRHPIPTANRVEESCMLITCARRYGLIAAATRIVHFGPLPDDLRRRHLATVSVDAAAIGASRPGVTMGELYERIVAAYAANGFPGE
ncbi:MAG: aminopeptidase P family protein, partial [Bacillota bacterium]